MKPILFLFAASLIGGCDANKDENIDTRSILAARNTTSSGRPSVAFGKPTIKDNSGMVTVMVEITNTGSNTTSCTLDATFKKGDSIMANASGAVNDIPPGGTRIAELITMEPIVGYDKLALGEGTCFMSGAATASPARSLTPTARDRGGRAVSFGKPTVKTKHGMTTVIVEASNGGKTTISCTLDATFKKGDTILTNASGAVNDIPPGGTKIAELIAMDPVAGYDALVLGEGTCFANRSASASPTDSKSTVIFGKPTIKTKHGMTTVMVEATNKGASTISCTLDATFKKGDTILTNASGAVNEISPGGTKVAELLTMDPVRGYTQLILGEGTCF